jgi:hypothetical protein
MPRSRRPVRSVATWLFRFGPLALLVLATVVVAVTSAVTAPRRPSVPAAHELGLRSSPGTTASVPTSTTTTLPTGSQGVSPVAWAGMMNGLQLGPDSVSCPSPTLCVFTGRPTEFLGQTQRVVSVSTGPFVPGRTITGHVTHFPQAVSEDDIYGPWYVSCPSTTLCVMSSPDTLYATSSPGTGSWVPQLQAPSGQEFGEVSCAGITFCAVILGNDILLSRSPLSGADTWLKSPMMDITEIDAAVSVLSCPSPRLCVAGGTGGFVGGWIEASTDPGGGPTAWS